MKNLTFLSFLLVLVFCSSSIAQTMKCKGSRTGANVSVISNEGDIIKLKVNWNEGSTFACQNLVITNGECIDGPAVNRNRPIATYTIKKLDASKDVTIEWTEKGTRRYCGETSMTISSGITSSKKYYIISSAGGLYLDNSWATRNKNGGIVQMWQKAGNTNQQWIFEKTGENQYMIKSAAGGLYLDNSWATRTKNGGTVQMWQKAGNTNQKWILEKVGEDEYMIKSAAGGLYLDNSWATRMKNGGIVQMWKRAGNTNQKWMIKAL